MKKILLTSAAVALSSSLFAQGIVNFQNSSSASGQVSINSTPGGPETGKTPTTAGAFYFEFLYSLSSAATENGSAAAYIPPATPVSNFTPFFAVSDTGFTDSGLLAENTASAGRVLGPLNATINALSAGASYTGVVIGWSANIGTTYQALVSFLSAPSTLVGGTPAYIGESVVGTFTAGGGSTSVPNVLAATPAISGFVVGEVDSPTPEPTTLALVGLGSLSMLALRRKKA
jgi:hypothetical protein